MLNNFSTPNYILITFKKFVSKLKLSLLVIFLYFTHSNIYLVFYSLNYQIGNRALLSVLVLLK